MYSVELKENGGKVEQTDIPTWYFEAKQLNETIHEYARWQQQTVDDYKERSFTDVLTGLKNRDIMRGSHCGVGPEQKTVFDNHD